MENLVKGDKAVEVVNHSVDFGLVGVGLDLEEDDVLDG